MTREEEDQIVGRLDAAESVLQALLNHLTFDRETAEALTKLISDGAEVMRSGSPGPRSVAQAQAMEGYALRVRT